MAPTRVLKGSAHRSRVTLPLLVDVISEHRLEHCYWTTFRATLAVTHCFLSCFASTTVVLTPFLLLTIP
jgi:hypothetical protein